MTELEAMREELASLRRRVDELERRAPPIFVHPPGRAPTQYPAPQFYPAQPVSPLYAATSCCGLDWCQGECGR